MNETRSPLPRLILASGSPRRRELLSSLGLEMTVRPVDLDETPRPGEPPEEYVLRLAREKAAWHTHSGEVVLAADTTVVLDGEILGKPADPAEAREMLGMHPQTLRMYERRGLLQPKRTSGNTRRYSERDIERIRAIQELTQRGTVATVRTQFLDAQRVYETNQRLFDENPDLVARADLERSQELVDELRLRLEVEEDRLAVMEGTTGEQIAAQEQQIDRLEELVVFNRDRLQSMQVEEGDKVFLTLAPGGFRLTPYDPDFEDAMAAYEEVAERYKNALRELAK